MTSGQHLSRELYNLIQSIGSTSSKQEEDKIILADLASLKASLSNTNPPEKKVKEFLIRAIYAEMLGHDASVAHIHAVILSQSKTLSLKRMGYLACSLFLYPESDLVILLVATMRKDLASKDIQEIIIALNTVTKIISAPIANALVDSVMKLLTHHDENVRKKSIVTLHKIYYVSPDSVPNFLDKLELVLSDRNPSVVGVVLSIYFELIKKNPQPFKRLVGQFVPILTQIIDNKFPKEYLYHGIPAPWIQIKLLQILGLIGAHDPKISEEVYETLSQTLKRSDNTGINIGFAVTYQCVKTIANVYPNQKLLEAAATTVSKFLNGQAYTNANNLKYLGKC
mgnify:CR=1 FL=1